MMRSEIARFLVAGGAAALLNWLARIGLSQVLPLTAAILLAYTIGMLAGFVLYRHFVFASAHEHAGSNTLGRQIMTFLGVNLAGAGVVVLATLALSAALAAILPAMPTAVLEALAHGAAIGIGAVSNYFGHRLLTFSTPVLQSR